METVHSRKTIHYLAVLFFLLVTIFFSGDVTVGLYAQGRLSPYEASLLAYINHYRSVKGLKPLSVDETLQGLAEDHSRSMDRNKYLTHEAFHERFIKSRRPHCIENVGWNSPTPEDQLRAWKSSEGHNINLLNRNIRSAGISKIGAFVTFFACD
jgi:uncharacterized protein YkwD